MACHDQYMTGDGAYPVVNYVEDTLLCSYPDFRKKNDTKYLPNPNGRFYVPFESDLSIQNPGQASNSCSLTDGGSGDAWFYHEGHVYDSPSNLWGKYLATAGRGVSLHSECATQS